MPARAAEARGAPAASCPKGSSTDGSGGESENGFTGSPAPQAAPVVATAVGGQGAPESRHLRATAGGVRSVGPLFCELCQPATGAPVAQGQGSCSTSAGLRVCADSRSSSAVMPKPMALPAQVRCATERVSGVVQCLPEQRHRWCWSWCLTFQHLHGAAVKRAGSNATAAGATWIPGKWASLPGPPAWLPQAPAPPGTCAFCHRTARSRPHSTRQE